MRVWPRLLKTRTIITVLSFLSLISILFIIYSFPREIDLNHVNENLGRGGLQELSARSKIIPKQPNLNLNPVPPLIPPALPELVRVPLAPVTFTSKSLPNVTSSPLKLVATKCTKVDETNKKVVPPVKSLQLPSQIFRAKTHPILRYPVSMPVASDLLAELSHSRLPLEELKEKANKTYNEIHSMKPIFDHNSGACQCERISDPCKCCLQVNVKQVKFEHNVCVNFTYLPSKQALRLLIALDDRVLLGDSSARLGSLVNKNNSSGNKVDQSASNNSHLLTSNKDAPPAKEATADPEVLLLAEDPPLVCVGDVWSLCTKFYDVTYEVLPTATHKTRLRGCLDITIQFHHQVIQYYHAGCFTSQSKEDEKVRLPPLFHVPGLT